jgi:hypothetical protein
MIQLYFFTYSVFRLLGMNICIKIMTVWERGTHRFWENTFCKVTPNVFGSLVWNLFHVSFLAPRILRSLMELWKICVSLVLDVLWCIDSCVSEQLTGSVINGKILQPSIKLHVAPSGNIDAHDLEEIIARARTHAHTHT